MSVLLSFGSGGCFRVVPEGQGYQLHLYKIHHHYYQCHQHQHKHQHQQCVKHQYRTQDCHHQNCFDCCDDFNIMFTHQVFFIIPCLDVYQKIDMRTSSYDVPPQEVILGKQGSYKKKPLFGFWVLLKISFLQILTKDSVTVFVNAIMYYKVITIFNANLPEAQKCTQGERRNFSGGKRGRLHWICQTVGCHDSQGDISIFPSLHLNFHLVQRLQE